MADNSTFWVQPCSHCGNTGKTVNGWTCQCAILDDLVGARRIRRDYGDGKPAEPAEPIKEAE